MLRFESKRGDCVPLKNFIHRVLYLGKRKHVRGDGLQYLTLLFLFLLFFSFFNPASSQTLFFLPGEEEGLLEVTIEGLNPHAINFYLLHPKGMREGLTLYEDSLFIPPVGDGDYKVYGDYVDEEISYRAKYILPSQGRERTYREEVGGGYLEILPLLPPEEMKEDTLFTGRVVRQGVPVEGVLLEVMDPNSLTFSVESNGEGLFHFSLKRPGTYIITGLYEEGPLRFTSYTLIVRDASRERAFQNYLYLLFLLLLFLYILIRYVRKIFQP